MNKILLESLIDNKNSTIRVANKTFCKLLNLKYNDNDCYFTKGINNHGFNYIDMIIKEYTLNKSEQKILIFYIN